MSSVLTNIPTQNFSALFLRHDRIGDVMISMPVFRILREHFPLARIDVLLGKRNAVMSNMIEHYADSTCVYDKKLWSTIRLLMHLRAQRYDVVIDMMDNPSRTSALLLRLLQPKVSLGFDSANKSIYTHSVALPNRATHHIVECMAQLLVGFDIAVEKEKLYLESGLEFHHRSWFSSGDVNASTSDTPHDLFINISGGKRSMWWGVKEYVELIAHVRSQFPLLRIAIGAGPEYQHELQAICSSCDAAVMRVSNTQNVFLYVEHLSKARVVLTPDTSIVHFASALGIPQAVLYNKPHPERMPWFPYQVDYRAVCATDEQGLRSVSVESVYSAVSELVSVHCPTL